jgi:hypothetical protein
MSKQDDPQEIARKRKTAYKFKDKSQAETRNFFKLQEFAILRDEYNRGLEKIDDKMPWPPEWFDLLKDHRDKHNLKDEWLEYVPLEIRNQQTQRVFQSLRKNTGNWRRHQEILHEWRVDWDKWMNSKKKRIKQLDANYNERSREIYKAANEANEKDWNAICPMLQEDNPDLRKTGPLYKKLKKMFPDKNYEKYTKEEKKKYNDWKKGLPKENLDLHNENKAQVEQLSRLKWVCPKNKLIFPYFQGQVARGKDSFVGLKERIMPDWVYKNFDPRFVRLVK